MSHANLTDNSTLPARGEAITVIIVNWNSCDYLRKCLASLARCELQAELHTIVVDNASFDGASRLVEHEFPGVQFVQLDRNIGFAGANNVGAARARGSFLLFLNPDTEVRPGAISGMLGAMNVLPGAGAVGCRLLNSDLSMQTSCVQAFPTLLNQLADADWLRKWTPGWSIWGNAAIYQRRQDPVPVDAISGACMLIRKQAFEDVRGFSSDYFMYAEDIDLCFKLRKAGSGIYYLGSAEVIHHGGKSSGRQGASCVPSVLQREAIWHFMRINRSDVSASLYRIGMGLIAIARLFLLGCAGILPASGGWRVEVKKAFQKWLGILSWSASRQRWLRRNSLTGLYAA